MCMWIFQGKKKIFFFWKNYAIFDLDSFEIKLQYGVIIV